MPWFIYNSIKNYIAWEENISILVPFSVKISFICAFNCFSWQFVLDHSWCLMICTKGQIEGQVLGKLLRLHFLRLMLAQFRGLPNFTEWHQDYFYDTKFVNCRFKPLERFSCCFSIVWTQLQYRKIINSAFVNRLYFSNFPFISWTTSIWFCLPRKYKGLRVKHAFFYTNFCKILTDSISLYRRPAAKCLLFRMPTSKILNEKKMGN